MGDSCVESLLAERRQIVGAPGVTPLSRPIVCLDLSWEICKYLISIFTVRT